MLPVTKINGESVLGVDALDIVVMPDGEVRLLMRTEEIGLFLQEMTPDFVRYVVGEGFNISLRGQQVSRDTPFRILANL